MTYKCSHYKLPQKYTKFGSSRLPVDARGNLYWTLGNWSSDMDRYHQIGIVHNAFQTWQPYFIPWEFKSTPDSESAQWKIYWVKGNVITLPDGTSWNVKDHGLFDFSKNKDTLAVQYASPDLLCLINDDIDYSFSTAGPTFFDLTKVLIHELGHGLLLGHTDQEAVKEMKKIDPAAGGGIPIMGAYYNKDARVTLDEERAIRTYHGAHLNEFRDHPTILRIMQTFAVKPEPLRRKKGCLGKILGW